MKDRFNIEQEERAVAVELHYSVRAVCKEDLPWKQWTLLSSAFERKSTGETRGTWDLSISQGDGYDGSASHMVLLS